MTISVGRRNITVSDYEKIISGTVGAEFSVEFDEYWDGYAKMVVFKNGNEAPIAYPILSETSTLIIPWETVAQAGSFRIGVYGEKDGTRTVTVWSDWLEILTGTDSFGIAPPPPTPCVYEYLVNLERTACEVAQSVRDDADNGVFDGRDGIDGTDGEKGDKGDKGDAGEDYVITSADYANIADIVETDLAPDFSATLQTAKDYTDNSIASDIKNVSYNSTSGVFTFTRQDNTTVTIDIPIENIVNSGYYDDENQNLVLVLESGQEILIPASGLIDDYTGGTSATVQVNVSSGNVITCNLVSGSISKTLLTSSLQSEINGKANTSDIRTLIGQTIVSLTQAQYDALQSKDSNVIYLVG